MAFTPRTSCIQMDEGGAEDLVFPVFLKAFDTDPHEIILEKLLRYGLEEQTVRWIENWLNIQAR